jgi:hydroxymethylpyrimidine pyrophosphatase-like HAD family hydrolase
LLLGSALASEVKLASTKYASKNFAMLDVLTAGCTKGAALAEWAGLQGLQRNEILAIGDNHNDLEMLKFAGIPVVMRNCVPELKDYGWHETPSNDENGVAAAIERFALSEAASCA